MNIGKILIVIGVGFILLGLMWNTVGKLPGDIVIKKGNTRVYFPIMTSIIISILLSLIFYFLNKFR